MLAALAGAWDAQGIATVTLAALAGAWDAQGIAAVVLALLLAWTLLRRTTTLDLLSIPSPWGLPLLGHLMQMALHVSNGHEQFLKWHQALGGIVRIRLLHRDVVLVADPLVAAQVLAKGPNECARRTPEYTTFDVVSCTGHSSNSWSGSHRLRLQPRTTDDARPLLLLLPLPPQAHGQRGFSAILTEQDEERWKAIRRGIAPAYAPSAVR